MIRLLIVDDNVHHRHLAMHFLMEVAGDKFEVEESRNGRAAVSRLLQNNIDVVLMDLRMPVMDGFEAVRLIRQFSDVPIMIMSAFGDAKSRQRIIDLGATHFIHKPPNYPDLAVKILSVAQKHRPVPPDHRIIATRRRLMKLKEQQACHGIDTPPKILMEIEDLEAEIEKWQNKNISPASE